MGYNFKDISITNTVIVSPCFTSVLNERKLVDYHGSP